jgi:phenylacetate-CoA ligase
MNTLTDQQFKLLRWRRRLKVDLSAQMLGLLENEFRPVEEQIAWQRHRLAVVVRWAVEQVPYYRRLFADRRLGPDDVTSPEQLVQWPILRKSDVIEFAADLRASALPPGERATSVYRSSGTTGRPVEVIQTQASEAMFSLLWMRQAWWFDLHPEALFADVRISREVARGTTSSTASDGVLVHRPQWLYLGQFFETGPEIAFNLTNSPEQQVAWLRQYRPRYVQSYPGTFEEWTLATDGHKPVDSLEALIGIGTHLTPSLRKKLEQIFQIPIHQTYGLNEIGKVALRCEAGRYHVHTEHCLVEIVDGQGQPCRPGETGHLLVTAFRNLAMPLLRYDTGDMAEAVEGPCPCGRTLPSFGEVLGRYRRYAGLPTGTRQRVLALTDAFDSFPPDQLGFVRRYQIHHHRDNRFELRLQTVAAVPESFREHIRHAWASVTGTADTPLTVVEVAHIEPSPGGKWLDFTSDLHQDARAT